MAAKHKATASNRKPGDGAAKQWSALRWADVDAWAGTRSVSRGRAYQRQGRVRDLVETEEGRLLASVLGGERYTVSVGFAAGRGRSRKLESTCTCPVGFDGCKHAVAVVAAFLDALAEGKPVPAADPDDPRWAKLSAEHDELDDEFDDDFDDGPDEDDELEEDDTDEELDEKRRTASGGKRAGRADGRGQKRWTRAQWDERIESHVRAMSHEELATLVCSLIERFPDLREEFEERISLAEGDVGRLVDQARSELRAVTAEVGWSNDWNDAGYIPDYSRLKHKLERLVEQGHSDEVVKLGRELIRRGMEQLGQSNDEGETGMELSGCLTVVFRALSKSSLSAADRLLYTIDACLQDGYDVISNDDVSAILDARSQRSDWSVVADRLAERLKKTPAGGADDGDFLRNYVRDQITNWLSQALEKAGRGDELLALYEAECRKTGSYERLVKHLLQQGRIDDAERWAREGIERTQEKLPGIAGNLLKLLCDVARGRKQWDVVAAHAAGGFFEHPDVRSFRELVAAADKAKCGDRIRAAALKFLESGRPPIRWSVDRKGRGTVTTDPAWPLPTPDYLAPRPQAIAVRSDTPRPLYHVLVDLAIAEKRPDDALAWYDKMTASRKQTAAGWGPWRGYGQPYGDRVAEAVASSHPERALDIYRRGLEAHLKHAEPSAYEACAACLRKMRPILKSLGREEEWTRLLADIRVNYRNRPRFMDVLDKLDRRTIVEAQKARRHR